MQLRIAPLRKTTEAVPYGQAEKGSRKELSSHSRAGLAYGGLEEFE
jgi:hypothetical protein